MELINLNLSCGSNSFNSASGCFIITSNNEIMTRLLKCFFITQIGPTVQIIKQKTYEKKVFQT